MISPTEIYVRSLRKKTQNKNTRRGENFGKAEICDRQTCENYS